jgi:glycolate oxidase FAD binding subunit
MTQGVRDVLASLVGQDAVLGPEATETFLGKGGDSAGQPVVVAPLETPQVAAVLARATEEGWRVLPAGGGGWTRDAVGSGVQVMVTTQRMTTMEEYEPADLTFTAEAGLTMKGLAEATGAHGQWLPLDPPGGRDGTLGGVVATAVPGPLRHLYGTARDHVLGLNTVSGDGRILRWGGRVVKNVAGFDVTRLVTGSWGTLGVVTSVSARLFPLPDVDKTLVFSGPPISRLRSGGQELARSALPLAAVELLGSFNGGTWTETDGSAGARPANMPPSALVLRLMGTEAQVEEMEVRIRTDVAGSLGAPTVFEGQDSVGFHGKHQEWEAGADLVMRLSLLPASLGVLFDIAEEIFGPAVEAGGGTDEVKATAHVGSGTLRMGAWGLSGGESTVSAWASAIEAAREEVESRGGSLRLSKSPSAFTNLVDPWGTPGPEAVIAQRLKAEFDPAGILAPGNLGL